MGDLTRASRAVLTALGLAGAALLVASCDEPTRPGPRDRAAAADPRPLVLAARVDTAITNATRDYLIDAVDEAGRRHAAALVVELDTPGGLLEATRDVVRAMLAADAPVVVYVTPQGARAGSAGVFLTLAANVAAMAPTTNIGAAHPVGLFGGDIDDTMSRKIENDTVAWAVSLAQTRGRNVEWAEKAVRESASLSSADAVREKVVDLMAEDLPDLLRQIQGRTTKVDGQDRVIATAGARVERLEMSGRQRLVSVLADPNLLYIMLLVGLFLLFIEFKNPGLIVPGVVGVLLVVLVLGVQVLPLNWIGVILILGAVALFVAEIYVTSFGLLAAAGLACLIVGSYVLFDVEGSSMRVDPQMIWGIGLTFAALLLVVGFLLVRAKRQGATTGVESLPGETAEVYKRITRFHPGQVRFRGAYWRATADDVLEPGTTVRVVCVDGTRVKVEKVESDG